MQKLKKKTGKYYTSRIDAFSGNSGSPIFDSSNKVIGILIGGNSIKYKKVNNCYKLAICSKNECEGEKIYKLYLQSKTLKKITNFKN